MVILPPGFVTTKYPGYFWNVTTKKLYSIKVGGVLRPLRRYPTRWIPNIGNLEAGYCVSVNGKRRQFPEVELMNLRIPVKTEIIPIV